MAIVHNSGMVDIDNLVTVKFYKGDPTTEGEEIGESVIAPTFPLKSSQHVSITWIAEGGLHEIYVVVDPEDEIQEINEENNIAFKKVGELPPPRNLVTAVDPETGKVSLVWDAPSKFDPAITGIVGFNVYRSTTSGSGHSHLASTDKTDYLDLTEAEGVTYYYVVTAHDTYGTESSYSNEASVTVP